VSAVRRVRTNHWRVEHRGHVGVDRGAVGLRGHAEPRGIAQGRGERQVYVDDVVLGHVTDGVTDGGVVLRDVEAVVPNGSGTRGADPGQRLEQCRLAGAAPTDDREELARFDRE
jgi:hypothetical protein